MAAAQDWTTSFETYFDTDALDVDDPTLGMRLDLQRRLGASVSIQRDLDYGTGNTGTLSFGLRREHYPDVNGNDRQFMKGSLERRWDLAEEGRRQLRLQLDVTHALDPSNRVFSRARISAAYRVALPERQVLQVRTRLGYRDQDEGNTFDGYDQLEFLTDISYSWQSSDWKWYVLGATYHDRRNAQNDIYSYGETGARLLTRYRLTDKLTTSVRVGVFDRSYANDFRSDQRLQGAISLEYALADNLSIETYGGYIRNASNVSSKDHEGPIFGVFLKLEFP